MPTATRNHDDGSSMLSYIVSPRDSILRGGPRAGGLFMFWGVGRHSPVALQLLYDLVNIIFSGTSRTLPLFNPPLHKYVCYV